MFFYASSRFRRAVVLIDAVPLIGVWKKRGFARRRNHSMLVPVVRRMACGAELAHMLYRAVRRDRRFYMQSCSAVMCTYFENCDARLSPRMYVLQCAAQNTVLLSAMCERIRFYYSTAHELQYIRHNHHRFNCHLSSFRNSPAPSHTTPPSTALIPIHSSFPSRSVRTAANVAALLTATMRSNIAPHGAPQHCQFRLQKRKSRRAEHDASRHAVNVRKCTPCHTCSLQVYVAQRVQTRADTARARKAQMNYPRRQKLTHTAAAPARAAGALCRNASLWRAPQMTAQCKLQSHSTRHVQYRAFQLEVNRHQRGEYAPVCAAAPLHAPKRRSQTARFPFHISRASCALVPHEGRGKNAAISLVQTVATGSGGRLHRYAQPGRRVDDARLRRGGTTRMCANAVDRGRQN
eukprot:IDg17069t1